MKILKQLCSNASSIEQYLAQGTAEEQQAVTDIQNKLTDNNPTLATSISALKAIEQQVNLLVVGEMFCPDCHVNISAFEFMAKQQQHIKLHLISRETAQKKLLSLLPLDEIKIPLVLVLDKNYQFIHSQISDNLFVERPEVVKQIAGFDSIKENYLQGDYLNASIEQILTVIK